MKIGLVNKFYPPKIGGIEYYVRTLAKGLSALPEVEKVEIVVANEENKRQVEIYGDKIKVVRVANWRTIASTPIAPGMVKALNDLDVDIFHFNFPYPFGDMAYLLSHNKKPLVLSYQSDIVRQKILNKFYTPVRKCFFNNVDRFIATSPNLIKYSNILSRYSDKTSVVPIGIDNSLHINPENKLLGKRLKNTYGDKPLLLFVGRLVYYKGVEILLDAMREIDANLIIVGKGVLKAKLEEFVRKYGMQDKIFFKSDISDEKLVQYFHACDIFVLPSVSITEAYGIVQVEAQMCGKPVISTNLPTGVPYVNQNGKTGLVVEPGNTEDLRRAIKQLLQNENLRLSLGRNAQKRALNEFTDVAMAKHTLEIYREVLESSARK